MKVRLENNKFVRHYKAIFEQVLYLIFLPSSYETFVQYVLNYMVSFS